MTAIDNENPTPEEAEETQHADSGIAGTESISHEPEATEEVPVDSAEENTEEEAQEEKYVLSDRERALFDTVASPNHKGWFRSLNEYQLAFAYALAFAIAVIAGFGWYAYNFPTPVPNNVYSKVDPSKCLWAEEWSIPARYLDDNEPFELSLQQAKDNDDATLTWTGRCKVY